MKPLVSRAFTLMELLVVIAIIGLLAAFTLAGTGIMKKKTIISRVKGELARVELAIGRYQLDLGFYPPENGRAATDPLFAAVPPLFYELSGVTPRAGGAVFDTFQVPETITLATCSNYFGRGGFANATAATNELKNFLPGLKESSYKEAFVGLDVQLLVVGVPGPLLATRPGLAPWREGVTPIRYLSKSARNHPKEFDLWVDVLVGRTTNRVSNWSQQPVQVSAELN